VLVRTSKAQSTLEYALLVAVVVGALLWMQNYLKRAVQGKLAASANDIGEQYSPGLTKIDETIDIGGSSTKIEEVTSKGFGGTTQTTITGGEQKTAKTTDIRPLGQEQWPAVQGGQ